LQAKNNSDKHINKFCSSNKKQLHKKGTSMKLKIFNSTIERKKQNKKKKRVAGARSTNLLVVF
jgi:hypothetical protein